MLRQALEQTAALVEVRQVQLLAAHHGQVEQERPVKVTTVARAQLLTPAAMVEEGAAVNLLLAQMVQMAQVATAAQVEQHLFPVLLRSTDQEEAEVRVVERLELAAQMLATARPQA